jgi:hypothetical protein
MKKDIFIWPIMVAMSSALCGCGPKKPTTTGYLSDYSRLRPESDVSYRYLAPNKALGRYSTFIIDPVEIFFHVKSKAEGKIKEQDLTDIKNYMHSALVEAIEDGYEIVYRPGPGVARLRVAITDLKKSRPVMNILPQTKLIGSGLGGATLEAELVDSETGEQIGAIVESQLGKRLSLEGISTWGDAKGVMDRWADRLRQRIDEAHQL